MNVKRVIFFDEDGRPYQVLSASSAICELQPGYGEDVLDAPEWATEHNCHLLQGVVAENQAFNLHVSSEQVAANGSDEVVISNVPEGATVKWPDGQVNKVVDSEVRFSVDLPGSYVLAFDAIGYLREEVTIEAVPAV